MKSIVDNILLTLIHIIDAFVISAIYIISLHIHFFVSKMEPTTFFENSI